MRPTAIQRNNPNIVSLYTQTDVDALLKNKSARKRLQNYELAVTKDRNLVRVEKKSPGFFGKLFGRKVRYRYHLIAKNGVVEQQVKASDLYSKKESQELLAKSFKNFIVNQLPVKDRPELQKYSDYVQEVAARYTQKESSAPYVSAKTYLDLASQVSERLDAVNEQESRRQQRLPSGLRAELARPLSFDSHQDFPYEKGAFLLMAYEQADYPAEKKTKEQVYSKENLDTIKSLMHRHVDASLDVYKDDPVSDHVRSYYHDRVDALLGQSQERIMGTAPPKIYIQQLETSMLQAESLLGQRWQDSQQGARKLTSNHSATSRLYSMINSQMGVHIGGGVLYEPDVTASYSSRGDGLRHASSTESLSESAVQARQEALKVAKQQQEVATAAAAKKKRGEELQKNIDAYHEEIERYSEAKRQRLMEQQRQLQEALEEQERQRAIANKKPEPLFEQKDELAARAVATEQIKKTLQENKSQVVREQKRVNRKSGERMARDASPELRYGARKINVDLNAPPNFDDESDDEMPPETRL